jgi:hypothetical protein
VVVAFVKPGNMAKAASLVAAIDKLVSQNQSNNPPLRAFVVFNGGPELKEQLEKLATEKNINVPLVFLPDGRPPAHFKINPDADNTVLVYRNKTVVRNFVNVETSTFTQVVSATAEMLKSP